MITMQSLMDEMTDLAGLARDPEPPFRTHQFSSYDRRSVTPEDPEGWFANRDWGEFLRTEEREGRTEYVMMDADGPGAIVRIWSANPKGTLRIYLDHEEEPALEVSMEELLSGRHPLLPEPVAGVRARGHNLYFPIPYARHAKVTSDEEEIYYLVNYRTYPERVDVRTFDVDQLAMAQGRVERLSQALASPGRAGAVPPEATMRWSVSLAPGDRFVVFRRGGEGDEGGAVSREEGDAPGGGGAIVHLVARPRAADLERATRGVILRAWFDGEQTVEAPLGDFFGAGPGVHPFEGLPLSHALDAEGEAELRSRWVMPFHREARIELHNLTDDPVEVAGEVGLVPWGWDDRSLHFHAGFRSEFDLPTRPMQDWNYLTVEGRGAFAGAVFTLDNPTPIWWGEGDEKIYVDGDDFPTWFGTGTEDYFGYAWCSPELFTHAYHAQARCDGPDNYGRTSVNRFHVIDRIPFRRSLRFDMEIWHWEDVKINAAVTTFWYGRPGIRSAYEPLGKEDVGVRPIPPHEEPPDGAVAEEGDGEALG